MQHPRTIGAPGAEAFLTMLVTERKVFASTNNQTLTAPLFSHQVLQEIDLPWLNDINRSANKRRIPSVLTKDEVANVLAHVEKPTVLLARLLYRTGSA